MKSAERDFSRTLPSDSRQMKIVLVNVVLVNVAPDGNRGACALTWASLDLVFRAFPQASVAIVPVAVTPPEVDPFRHTLRRYPNVTILPPLFDGEGKRAAGLLCRLAARVAEVAWFDRERPNGNPTLEWIRNSDLAVSIGGVVFENVGGTLREDARLLIRLLPLLAAQSIGVPSVIVGAQVGPFRSRFAHLLCRRIFRRASALFPRDHVSASDVESDSQHARSMLMPDSAFALQLHRADNAEILTRRGLDPSAATLALIISSAIRPEERREDHLALFAAVSKRLIAAGVVTQIIIVRQSDEDRAIGLDLARRLEIDPRFFIDDDLSPEELSNLYGFCRMVVSSRLHAVILAMLAGAPAVSLAPEVTFKERAVLAILGLESLWVPTRVGAEQAAATCLAIASDDQRHRKTVAAAVAAARARWDEIPPLLREVVVESRAGAPLTKRVTRVSA
jgi:polysaccharide pyruvyl transferase WcaK-like protein